LRPRKIRGISGWISDLRTERLTIPIVMSRIVHFIMRRGFEAIQALLLVSGIAILDTQTHKHSQSSPRQLLPTLIHHTSYQFEPGVQKMVVSINL
jgi:hypothetical protein